MILGWKSGPETRLLQSCALSQQKLGAQCASTADGDSEFLAVRFRATCRNLNAWLIVLTATAGGDPGFVVGHRKASPCTSICALSALVVLCWMPPSFWVPDASAPIRQCGRSARAMTFYVLLCTGPMVKMHRPCTPAALCCFLSAQLLRRALHHKPRLSLKVFDSSN